MLPTTLLPELATLPPHIALMLAAIVGSGLFCLLIALVGALRQWCCRRSLPPLPSLPPYRFPTGLDQLYTALFCGFILWAAAKGLLDSLCPTEGDPPPTSMTWGLLLLGVATQVAIYLPMLLRYALVHPWCRPSRPWLYYIRTALAVWATIYLAILALEHSGFNRWLIEVTGCPEHQDLVLTFSRGSALQKLHIIICAVFVAPVVEECCFRGFLYTTLRRWSGGIAAALGSALLFGAIHASLAQLLPLTLFGLVQCYAYERERSLWLPIAVHMLFNTTTLIVIALLRP